MMCGVSLVVTAGIVASFFVRFSSQGLHGFVLIVLIGLLIGALVFIIRVERELRPRRK
jgi:Na+-driven multidrug efflux pump